MSITINKTQNKNLTIEARTSPNDTLPQVQHIDRWNENVLLAESNGFNVFPNGIIIQWGITNDISLAPGATSELSILLPTTFPEKMFNISPTIMGPSSISISVLKRSTSTVTFGIMNNSSDPQSLKITYQAIGH